MCGLCLVRSGNAGLENREAFVTLLLGELLHTRILSARAWCLCCTPGQFHPGFCPVTFSAFLIPSDTSILPLQQVPETKPSFGFPCLSSLLFLHQRISEDRWECCCCVLVGGVEGESGSGVISQCPNTPCVAVFSLSSMLVSPSRDG